MAASDWCTIESCPGVFTALIELFGVKGVQVEELYDLEDSTFDNLRPIHGLIFLFKWQATSDEDRAGTFSEPSGLFFAKQVISNACATQAIVSILLNSPHIDIGEELNSFKNFTMDLPPDMRGLSLANSETIRVAHNSFSRPEPFVLDENQSSSDDDEAFHFVSYIPFQGNLYELDGLQRSAICHGPCTEENWLSKARPVIQSRIQKYSQSEIRFNLMAVVQNRSQVYEARIDKMQKRLETAKRMLDSPDNAMDVSDADGFELPTDRDQLMISVSAMEEEISLLRAGIESEKRKFETWKVENQRRKHNYLPFVVSLLQKLAEKGELLKLAEKAKKKQFDRLQALAAAKKAQ